MQTLRRAGLLAGLCVVCVSASAQQTVERPPVLSVETDLVTLAVTVVDRHGVFVAGLRQEDFTVYDEGEPRSIQFFTSEDLPATIGLVIDSSGSMRRRSNDVAAAVTAFAALRHPFDELFTVNFNEAVWAGLPPAVAFTSDPDELRSALTTAPPQGMSALYDAVDRALAHLGLGTRDRKALIVVSDGGDNASTQTFDAVLEHARRSKATIYTLSLFDPDDGDARPRVLRALARETGGASFAPRRPEDVTGAFMEIARELRSGYTIGFRPPGTPGGGFRSIRVVVGTDARRRLIVRTRAGYYAGP